MILFSILAIAILVVLAILATILLVCGVVIGWPMLEIAVCIILIIAVVRAIFKRKRR